jgi:hypothetical protein
MSAPSHPVLPLSRPGIPVRLEGLAARASAMIIRREASGRGES